MKPKLTVIAGPNGSGKTTFALEYLKSYSYPYVSADVIAESMHAASIDEVRLEAGRAFLERVAAHVQGGASLVVESTLSGLTFRNVMERAREAGFQVTIVFIFLGSERACVARIRERVRKGGHAVSEEAYVGASLGASGTSGEAIYLWQIGGICFTMVGRSCMR